MSPGRSCPAAPGMRVVRGQLLSLCGTWGKQQWSYQIHPLHLLLVLAVHALENATFLSSSSSSPVPCHAAAVPQGQERVPLTVTHSSDLSEGSSSETSGTCSLAQVLTELIGNTWILTALGIIPTHPHTCPVSAAPRGSLAVFGQ